MGVRHLGASENITVATLAQHRSLSPEEMLRVAEMRFVAGKTIGDQVRLMRRDLRHRLLIRLMALGTKLFRIIL